MNSAITHIIMQCRRSNMSSTDLLNNHFNNEALACFLNVTSKDLGNVIYGGRRLKWCNDLTSLKTFVAEVLRQNGKWCSPGGYSKKFISSNAELTLTWYQGKLDTLLFQDKDGNLVGDKCVSLCRAQSCTSKLSRPRILSVNRLRFVKTIYRIIQLTICRIAVVRAVF